MSELTELDQLAQLKEEYAQCLHAIQTGVAYTMEFDPAECEPKHIRVGINSALCSIGALTTLLVEKGIVTEEEYLTKIIQILKEDVERYQRQLSKHYGGSSITLF